MPRDFSSLVLDGAQEFAFLTSLQVMMILQVHDLDFE